MSILDGAERLNRRAAVVGIGTLAASAACWARWSGTGWNSRMDRVASLCGELRAHLDRRVTSESATIDIAHAILAGPTARQGAWLDELRRRALGNPHGSWIVSSDGSTRIRQHPRFGEAHPGQIVAYMGLAGLSAAPLAPGLPTWSELVAVAVAKAAHTQGELGHLALGAALICPDSKWRLAGGAELDLRALLGLIDRSAHEETVCWGLHACHAMALGGRLGVAAPELTSMATAFLDRTLTPQLAPLLEVPCAFAIPGDDRGNTEGLALYAGHLLEVLSACRGTRWLRVGRRQVDEAVDGLLRQLPPTVELPVPVAAHLCRGLDQWHNAGG